MHCLILRAPSFPAAPLLRPAALPALRSALLLHPAAPPRHALRPTALHGF